MITIKTKDENVEVDEKDIYLISSVPLFSTYCGIVHFKNADTVYSTQTVFQIKKYWKIKDFIL